MKQKVFVQGRETQSVHVVRDYPPSKENRNSFSEIDFSQSDTGKRISEKRLHVRYMGDKAQTQFPEVGVWKGKG